MKYHQIVKPFIVIIATAFVFLPMLNGAKRKRKPIPINKPGVVQLVLPETIYGVAGVEMNVYFDNVALMLNRNNYAFDVTCKVGKHQQERWTFTPTEKNVGEHPFQIEIKDAANKLVAVAYSRLFIHSPQHKDKSKKRERSMLIIGDSLTAASYYPQRLLDLVESNKSPKVKLIGTTGKGKKPGKTNRHEGYGGWTALRFATLFDVKHPTNRSPFVYQQAGKKPALDFKRYCQENNNGTAPDFVTIFLAPNDIFHSTDETIEEKMKVMLTHYDQLIAMVHKYNQHTKIGVMMPIPPAGTQDAFGSNYQSNKTRWEYRRHQHLLRTRMLNKYGSRELENIFIVPLAVNIDCMHNYPTKTEAVNARSPKKITRLANGVHPAKEGYNQIGDSLYAWYCVMIAD